MRRAELRLLKDRDAQDNRQVPAVGAIATVYRQGATVSAAVEVHEHDTLTVPVYSPGRLQYGDDVVAIGGPDREFQVRALGETSLELDYLGTSDLILSPGERIYPTTPLQVFAEATGAVPLSSLTSDSRGLVAFYCPEARFDYAVSGATAGTAAGFYPDGQAGWGQGELSWLNARNFPSIQAAIDSLPPAGGTVFLPAGLYTLTNTLYLPCDRPCHLIGEGRHESPARGTVLQWSTNVGMLKLRGDYSSVKSLTLRNTSGGQATREDQGYGIMIGRRNLNDPHPPPEPSTSPLQSEYLRGGRIPMHAVLIEDVTIQGAPGWAIHIPGFGKLSDEVTNEYDAVVPSPTEGGTLSLWVDLKRVRTVGSVRYGALFVGTGCTTTFFENCGFLVQGMGQVVNDTWYVYLAGCALPVFVRCTIEGQSPTTKPWVRMFGTVDPVFDCCWFENNGPSIPRDPTYFLNLAGGCRVARFDTAGSCETPTVTAI